MDRIIHSSAVDIGGGRRGFRSKDTVAGIPGTVVTAAHMNAEQEELLCVIIERTGQVPSTANLAQLAMGIRSQRLNYVEAGGTANALTVTMELALAARIAGMPIRVKIAATNTGPVSLDDGLGAVPVTTVGGAALAKGDLPKDTIAEFVWTGTRYMTTGLVYSETLRPLASDLTLYVRPDGNDNNEGSANTAAGAFQTIQAAVTYATRRYYTAGYLVTIQLADGNYAGFRVIENGQCRLLIRGNPAAQANVVITPAAGQAAVLAQRGASVSLDGMTVTGGSNGLAAVDRSLIEVSNVRFGACANFQIFAGQSATVNVLTGISFFGSARAAMTASSNSTISASGLNLSFVGALAYSVATVWANNGSIIVDSSNFFGGGGTVTGPRFQVDTTGVIYVNGGGPAFIIGSAAGLQFTGGQYI